MKKITVLLIGCTLAIAATVVAQQPEAQESPAKKGGRAEKTTQGTTENAPKTNVGEKRGKGANATQPTTTETGAAKQGVGKHEPRRIKGQEATTGAGAEAAGMNATETGKKGKRGRNATTNTAETGAAASPGASAPKEMGKKGKRGRGESAGASPSRAPSAGAKVTPATSATGANAATTNANANVAQGTVGKGGKKVETQQIQQIKQQHTSFKAQPKPNVAPAVTFNQNYRISGAESWQGPQYEVFRTYHPEWHDQGWYHSHYGQVVLIAGGWYFLNNGYWYPAWGYDPGVAYYAYDGPIYVGHRALPPDQVIADVQAVLQDMGYYTGEVDGLLGPLTRQALRDYQAEHGLMVTEAIDEPTLDSLQLS